MERQIKEERGKIKKKGGKKIVWESVQRKEERERKKRESVCEREEETERWVV